MIAIKFMLRGMAGIKIVPFILLLLSCSAKEYSYISETDFSEIIRMEKKGGFDVLARIDAMTVVGNKLLVRADQSTNIFSLYDLNGEVRKTWGNKGRAPGEYMVPMISKVDFNSFMVYDIPIERKEYYLINGDSLFMQESIKLNNMHDMPLSIHSMNKNTIVYDRRQPKELSIYKYHDDGTIIHITSMEDYKEIYSDSKVYMGYMEINPMGDCFVYAFQYIDGFDIYDMQGNAICKVRRESFKTPSNSDYSLQKTYCFAIDKSENGFLLYRVNYSGNELMNNLSCVTYIEEYDWSGNPIRRYELPLFASNIAYIGNGEFMVYDAYSEDESIKHFAPSYQ